MKLDKEVLKTLIKESLEEINYKKQRLARSVGNVMSDVEGREPAMLGTGPDQPLTVEQTNEIVRLHHLYFEDLVADLGQKDSYNISELFGWLGY